MTYATLEISRSTLSVARLSSGKLTLDVRQAEQEAASENEARRRENNAAANADDSDERVDLSQRLSPRAVELVAEMRAAGEKAQAAPRLTAGRSQVIADLRSFNVVSDDDVAVMDKDGAVPDAVWVWATQLVKRLKSDTGVALPVQRAQAGATILQPIRADVSDIDVWTAQFLSSETTRELVLGQLEDLVDEFPLRDVMVALESLSEDGWRVTACFGRPRAIGRSRIPVAPVCGQIPAGARPLTNVARVRQEQ